MPSRCLAAFGVDGRAARVATRLEPAVAGIAALHTTLAASDDASRSILILDVVSLI
jgi:hypothetical protein